MTDAELDLASVPAASDCLEERGMPGAAALLRDAPSRAALLERAIALMGRKIAESILHFGEWLSVETTRDEIALIAEHRGEPPEATLARLRPPPSQSHGGGPSRFAGLVADAAEAGGARVHWAPRDGPIDGLSASLVAIDEAETRPGVVESTTRGLDSGRSLP